MKKPGLNSAYELQRALYRKGNSVTQKIRSLCPHSLIKSWIEKNLVDTDDPRRHGKGLASNRSGQWRYRVGNYRILAEIEDRELIILVIEVGHRSIVYEA